jgi:hypothetical protein
MCLRLDWTKQRRRVIRLQKMQTSLLQELFTKYPDPRIITSEQELEINKIIQKLQDITSTYCNL